jgi:MFS transporter, ACS family, tartrate transporter
MARDHYRSAIRKAAIRLLPFLALCYAANFLDRVNVGFAALTMNKDLGFSPETYGFGAGIFFAGYSCSRCRAISRCNISAHASGSPGS